MYLFVQTSKYHRQAVRCTSSWVKRTTNQTILQWFSGIILFIEAVHSKQHENRGTERDKHKNWIHMQIPVGFMNNSVYALCMHKVHIFYLHDRWIACYCCYSYCFCWIIYTFLVCCVFFSVQLFMEFKLTKHLPLTQCTFYEIIGSNTTHVCARPSITREYFKLCSKEILASCTFPHEFHIFGVGQCN